MRNDPNIKDNNFTLYLFMNIHVFYLSQLHREIRKNNFYSKKDLTEENVKEIIKIIDELVEKQNMFVSIFNGFLLGHISNDELLKHVDLVLGGDGDSVSGLNEMVKNMNDVLSGKIDEEEYQRRIEAFQSENIENEKNNNDDVENNLNEKADEKNNNDVEDSVEIENDIETSENNEDTKNTNQENN
jgi:hypothetical protein